MITSPYGHDSACTSGGNHRSGTLDITGALTDAFAAAGSQPGLVSSYTGQGLEADWPEAGRDLRGGWRVGEASLVRADGVWTTPRHRDIRIGSAGVGFRAPGRAAEAFVAPPVSARFFLWEFKPRFVLDYAVSRQRIERLSLALTADVQRVFAEPGEEEVLVLALGSRKVAEITEGVLPVGDLRRRAYFATDRGRRSIDYLVALARAKLLARARAVETDITLPFADGVGLSCRMNATIVDDRLPGGSATGKVVAYTLRADGSGGRVAELRIGCTIGNGTAITAEPGTPDYAEDGYADAGWQRRTGETIMPIAGEVAYSDPAATPVIDDGIDFLQFAPAEIVLSLDVPNGEAAQAAVLGHRFADIPAAVEALNAAHTEVVLELKPLTGGPFETRYDLEVTPLAVPRTLTL